MFNDDDNTWFKHILLSKHYITLYIVAHEIGSERKYDYLFSSSP